MILRKQILVYRRKTNGFFVIKNIRKWIYIKRFNEFAFMVVSFNSFLDISITRDHTGTLDTNIYRKPTHSERYLNFKSEHPLEHKSAVVNVLTHRANSLIRDDNKKQMELKHIENVLTLNGYPNWLLNRKLEIKSDPPICYTLNSQCCWITRYCDNSLCSKAFRKVKINFTKAWNSNCI